jgi:Flp pilus assembly pilin Flp
MSITAALAVFAREDQGQDMVEYTLLLAFFVLAGVALYLGISNNINGIWTGISNRLANSN